MKISTIIASGLFIAALSVGLGVSASQQASAATTSYTLPCSYQVPEFGVTGNNSIRFAPGNFCLVNAQYKAVFQTDGNFVVYKGDVALWSSQTNGKVGNKGFLQFQSDGNLVIYNAQSVAVWTTNTRSTKPSFANRTLRMQSDSNLVLYGYPSTPVNAETAAWSSIFGTYKGTVNF